MALFLASSRSANAFTSAMSERSAISTVISDLPVSASKVSSSSSRFAGLRMTRVKSAPASASATLVARPKPLLAPVKTTCRPSRKCEFGFLWAILRRYPHFENMATPGATQRSARAVQSEIPGGELELSRADFSPCRLSLPMARMPDSSWCSKVLIPKRYLNSAV